MLKQMTIRTRLFLLSGLLSGLMAIVAAAALYELGSSVETHNASLDRFQLMTAAINTIKDVRSSCLVQIKEFKNALLCGQNAGEFQKHADGFSKAAAKADENLAKAKDILKQLGVDAAEGDHLSKDHSEVTAKYGEALKDYNSNRSKNITRVNDSVMGMGDRLVEGIDTFAQKLSVGLDQDIDELQ